MILLCLFIKNSPQHHLVSILSSHADTKSKTTHVWFWILNSPTINFLTTVFTDFEFWILDSPSLFLWKVLKGACEFWILDSPLFLWAASHRFWFWILDSAAEPENFQHLPPNSEFWILATLWASEFHDSDSEFWILPSCLSLGFCTDTRELPKFCTESEGRDESRAYDSDSEL